MPLQLILASISSLYFSFLYKFVLKSSKTGQINPGKYFLWHQTAYFSLQPVCTSMVFTVSFIGLLYEWSAYCVHHLFHVGSLNKIPNYFCPTVSLNLIAWDGNFYFKIWIPYWFLKSIILIKLLRYIILLLLWHFETCLLELNYRIMLSKGLLLSWENITTQTKTKPSWRHQWFSTTYFEI